jgi:Plasmid pRiA4b ORF-3-like protein
VHSYPPTFGDTFELRVTLRNIEPAVWRSLRVPVHVPLNVLHDALQTAFGWKNCHLHDFRVDDIRFGMVDADDEMFCVDERAAPLGAVARVGSKLVYLYDFGDDWEHDIVVEGVDAQRDDPAILCTGGARACPPEDCGGPFGYARMLDALANPTNDEHAELREWAPLAFDAEKFNLAAVNKKLATLSKRVARRRTSHGPTK